MFPQDDKVRGMSVTIGERVTLTGFKRSRNFTARLLARAFLLETDQHDNDNTSEGEKDQEKDTQAPG